MKCKIFFYAALILSTAMLSSCSENSSGNIPVSDPDSETSLSRAAADTGTTPPPFTGSLYGEAEASESAKRAEEIFYDIVDNIAEFKEFAGAYLERGMFVGNENVDISDRIIENETDYFCVTGGDYREYSSLYAAAESFCTSDVIEDLHLLDGYRADENDVLYVMTEPSDDTIAVFDAIYAESAAELDDGSVKVYLCAVGYKESFGYNEDLRANFEITMICDGGSWKISSCGYMEYRLIQGFFDRELR